MSDHNRPRVKNENYDWDDILLEWTPHIAGVAASVGGATAANQVTGNTSLATIATVVHAEGVAFAGGDKGVELLGVVNATAGITTSEGNFSHLAVDQYGQLITSGLSGTIPLDTSGNALGHKTDDAFVNPSAGIGILAIRKATPTNISGTDGDYEMLQMSAGRLWVDASGKTLNAAAIPTTLLYASGSTAASGATAIVTPTAGKKVQVRYASYNPSSVNEVYFRLGGAGTPFLRNGIITGGSIIMKDFGDFRYIEGATNEVLYLYQTGAFDTIWNIFYTEGT